MKMTHQKQIDVAFGRRLIHLCSRSRFIKLLIPLLLLVLGSLTLEAQSGKTVSGKITFSTGGEPVPGANITVQGSHAGTISDINGNYSIMVNEGDVLVISFVGYLNEHVVIGNTDTYNISLREDITQLDEVIKIGYGTMKRSDLTGAVVSISNEEIQRTVSTSFDQALQGRAAGVSVTQNSGQPGGSVSVRIRGINSLNANNEPLYVIDGVPIEGHSGNNSTNILSQISPADIVSMEVLKDASATAIYGSRAANGVILITTQRGKSGETRIGYDGFYAIQQLPYYIETMTLSEYAEYQNQRAELIGFGAREEFADPSVLGEGTNWQKEMFTNAPMQSHQVSLSGGDEQTTFSLSGGYLNQDGIAIGSNFERFTLRFTLDNQTRRWLKMGTSVYASRTKQRITVQDNNLIQQTLRQTPDVPLKNPDGSWGGPSENIYGTYSTNVVAEALMRENDKKGAQVIANLYAEIEFAKGLTFRSEFGGTVGYTTEYYYQPAFSFGFYENTINESRRSTGNSIYWLAKNYITYNKIFLTRHTLTVMAGQEAQENAWEGISGSRNNFLTNNVHELNAGDANTAKNSGHKGSSSLSSLFGRINYDYDDRYLLTATIRRDGSSKFGENNRFGLFPSFSLAWRLNNEAFFKNVSIVSNLKLRGGWGLVGNQNIPDYAYGAAMTSHTTIWGVGLLPSNMPNPDVQWESTAAINLGMDLSLFRNRIEFIADAYVKNTDNLLMQKPLPSYAGTAGQGAISSPWVNIGAIENKGLEFTLNTVNIDNRSFYWRSGLVFSTNRNRVTRLYTENSIVDKTVGTTIITRTIVDQPVGQFYGYDIIGMFEKEEDFYTTDESGNRVLVALPQDGQEIAPNGIWVGDFRFRDVNEDGVITEADRTFIGSPHPKFELGFNNNFSYMNLDLAFNITGVFGNKIYNWTRSEFESPMSNLGLFSSVSEYARIGVYDENLTGTDPGTGDELGAYQILSNVYITNPGTDIPRVTVYDANSNNRVSDRYIEDGSYIRLKNVIVGYTLPAKWVNKISIEQVRLYMNIQNLYTFSKYKGYDPEVGSLNQDMLLTGIDQYRYPSQRLFTFGVNVDF